MWLASWPCSNDAHGPQSDNIVMLLIAWWSFLEVLVWYSVFIYASHCYYAERFKTPWQTSLVVSDVECISDVTWSSLCPNSTATLIFVQRVVQADTKESPLTGLFRLTPRKAPSQGYSGWHQGKPPHRVVQADTKESPLTGLFRLTPRKAPSQRASNAESVSIVITPSWKDMWFGGSRCLPNNGQCLDPSVNHVIITDPLVILHSCGNTRPVNHTQTPWTVNK